MVKNSKQGRISFLAHYEQAMIKQVLNVVNFMGNILEKRKHLPTFWYVNKATMESQQVRHKAKQCQRNYASAKMRSRTPGPGVL